MGKVQRGSQDGYARRVAALVAGGAVVDWLERCGFSGAEVNVQRWAFRTRRWSAAAAAARDPALLPGVVKSSVTW